MRRSGAVASAFSGSRGRPFERGTSGNPSGRPKGHRNKATLAMEELLDGDAPALTRKVIERALEGDMVAMRLCLERVLPPRRDRPVAFALPKVELVKDVPAAAAAIPEACADGMLSPGEAAEIMNCSRPMAEPSQNRAGNRGARAAAKAVRRKTANATEKKRWCGENPGRLRAKARAPFLRGAAERRQPNETLGREAPAIAAHKRMGWKPAGPNRSWVRCTTARRRRRTPPLRVCPRYVSVPATLHRHAVRSIASWGA